MDDGNSPTTRLLTLLNISATKIKKRKQENEEAHLPRKLNKRKSINFASDNPESIEVEPELAASVFAEKTNVQIEPGNDQEAVSEQTIEVQVEDEPQDLGNSYDLHFGPNPGILTAQSREAVDSRKFKNAKETIGKSIVISTSIHEDQTIPSKISIHERLRTPFEKRQAKQTPEQTQFQNDLLAILCSHRDVYQTCLQLDRREIAREAVALHAIDHVTRKRRRILKNNERLAHAKSASTSPPEDVQDQGFTRPSVLVLLPFRSSALDWLNAFTLHTPQSSYQIENQSRFLSEYSLPPGAIDKLVSAEPGTYPLDHVATFKGNIDDNFRVGIKMTRKSVKLFADFYDCDIIFASPLGLRMSIEKEKSADFLSSIEILVVDQMEALIMQNWEHVQFVFSNLNKLPKESHDTDFSRIKPWYLDGHSIYLRQSILFSAFETPETRALYQHNLKNVAGRVRTEKQWLPVQVPASIDQLFVRFDCTGPKDEADKRFDYFTTQLLPKIMKSAVQCANTAVFIPSSFDFIRVHNYFRKNSGVSFAVLSEYSSNQEIARARQSFFSGKKNFLLISERFHFFRRYKIRGIRNLLFFGPPDHPQFFSELLSYPFLDDGVDASDVTCRVLYCKLDRFRMERIMGSQAARQAIRSGEL